MNQKGIFPSARSPRGIAAVAYATNMPPACLLYAAGPSGGVGISPDRLRGTSGSAEIQWQPGIKTLERPIGQNGVRGVPGGVLVTLPPRAKYPQGPGLGKPRKARVQKRSFCKEIAFPPGDGHISPWGLVGLENQGSPRPPGRGLPRLSLPLRGMKIGIHRLGGVLGHHLL